MARLQQELLLPVALKLWYRAAAGGVKSGLWTTLRRANACRDMDDTVAGKVYAVVDEGTKSSDEDGTK